MFFFFFYFIEISDMRAQDNMPSLETLRETAYAKPVFNIRGVPSRRRQSEYAYRRSRVRSVCLSVNVRQTTKQLRDVDKTRGRIAMRRVENSIYRSRNPRVSRGTRH